MGSGDRSFVVKVPRAHEEEDKRGAEGGGQARMKEVVKAELREEVEKEVTVEVKEEMDAYIRAETDEVDTAKVDSFTVLKDKSRNSGKLFNRSRVLSKWSLSYPF